MVLTKFGFLQILESLALGKPTVIVGEAGALLQNKDNLDPLYRKLLETEHLSDTEEVFKYFEQLIHDTEFRSKKSNDIKRAHDGSLQGAKKAAELIQTLILRNTKRISRKKLAILVNEEIVEKQAWLKEESGVYPLCIVWATPQQLEVIKRLPEYLGKTPLRDIQQHTTNELFPSAFKELYVFSHRKYDGFIAIDRWYDLWIHRFELLIQHADEIYISNQGLTLFEQLLVVNNGSKKIRAYT